MGALSEIRPLQLRVGQAPPVPELRAAADTSTATQAQQDVQRARRDDRGRSDDAVLFEGLGGLARHASELSLLHLDPRFVRSGVGCRTGQRDDAEERVQQPADGPVAAGPLIVVRNDAQLEPHDAEAQGELIANRRRKHGAGEAASRRRGSNKAMSCMTWAAPSAPAAHAVTNATASKMASTQPRETSSGTPVTSSSSVRREFVLPSSNGGADGAIGVCSLNLLGGVSGTRFGVLPSDMFLQCVWR